MRLKLRIVKGRIWHFMPRFYLKYPFSPYPLLTILGGGGIIFWMRVKICGITNVEDALLAAELGADALGVIAVPETPRYVSAIIVAQIRAVLPPFLPLVVVAKNAQQAQGYEKSADAFQLYDGPLIPGARCVRVVRVRDASSLAAVAQAAAELVSAVHLDAYHEKALGGAGVAFDWSLAVAAKASLQGKPLILAGGLTPENVAEAIALVQPYAVDISSGVEAFPGKKDPQKLRDFIAAAKSASPGLVELGHPLRLREGGQ